MLNLCVYLICKGLTKDILINILRKSILIWKKINSQDVLKGLDSSKFLEILNSNKTPNEFSTTNLIKGNFPIPGPI